MLPMEEHYTYESMLVQFLYRDVPAGEAAATAEWIDEDPMLQRLYAELMLAKTKLPKVQFNPSTAVIDNILQYSTKTALEAHL